MHCRFTGFPQLWLLSSLLLLLLVVLPTLLAV
jgi:hypothetical protein